MKRVSIYVAALLAAFWFAGCQQAFAECGFAAAYPQEGEAAHGVSAAHQSLPLGTRVVVRNQRRGRSIVVRITDRSPYLSGHVIDLSPRAMSALGIDAQAPVCLEVVSYGSQKRGYEKPSLVGRLLEAVIPGRHRHANAHSQTRSAKVRSGTRSAKVHHRRKHYARAHHGSGKRYAKVHRRHSARRSSRRRRAARG
ncbi:MAG: septal ring lytic transglycosylase RlpA family protein [Rhodomicrobium sp.]